MLNLKSHWRSFLQFFSLFYQHRGLILQLTKRDFAERHMGQIFGLFWILVHPVILMGVYVFIFTVVARVKMPTLGDGLEMSFAIYILSGLIPWLAFVDGLNRAASVLYSNSSLIKQVIFPVETLPIVPVCIAFFTQTIFLSLFVLYICVIEQAASWSLLLIFPLSVLQFVGMCGISYWVSALTVYFRDLKDFIQIFSFVGIYLLPIVYTPASIPTAFRWIISWNPLSHAIWCYHDVFYYGSIQNPLSWGIMSGICIFALSSGFLVFNKLKIYFGNVL